MELVGSDNRKSRVNSRDRKNRVKRREERMGRKKYRDEEKPKRYYDFTMLVLILLLTVFGLVIVASASSYTAIKYDLGATYFFKRQALFAAIGIGIMIAVSQFDYGLLIKKPKFLLKRTPVGKPSEKPS